MPRHEPETIGVLAGMGAFAGATFLRALFERARVAHGARDNDAFPHVLLSSVPVPSLVREDARGDEVFAVLSREAKALAGAGADFLVVVCNTVHAYLPELEASAGRPFVSMVQAAVDALARDGRRRVAVLATATTNERELYQRPLKQAGIDVVPLLAPEQDAVTEAVVRGIAGELDEADRASLARVGAACVSRGADAVLVACTELSTIELHLEAASYDALALLVEAACSRVYDAGGSTGRPWRS